MPSSLAKIYIGQRSRTGDASGAGNGGWGGGIGGWGFDIAVLPGALSSALAGTLLGSALSGYFASASSGQAKRPATSDYPRRQPSSPTASGRRPATSSGRPWSGASGSSISSAEQWVDNPGRLRGRLSCIVPAEPLTLPGDSQSRRPLQGTRFEPQSAHSARVLASQSPPGMPLTPSKPRTRELVRSAILKEDDVDDLLAADLWSSDNDVLQMKQRSHDLRKRTVELLQRAEEAETQYTEQFLLPSLVKSSSSRTAVEPTAGGPSAGAEPAPTGSDSEASEAGAAKDRAHSPESDLGLAEAISRTKAKVSPKRQAKERQSLYSPRLRRKSNSEETPSTTASTLAAASSSTTIGGSSTTIVGESSATMDMVVQDAGSPVVSPGSSPRPTLTSERTTSPGSANHGRARNKLHGSHDLAHGQKPPNVKTLNIQNDGQGAAKNSDKRVSMAEEDVEIKEIEEVKKGTAGRPQPKKKDKQRGKSFNEFMQHGGGVRAPHSTHPRNDERKVFEVSKKMDLEAHSSLALISMFLGRNSGSLRIHVLLMSNNTHLELVVEAAHVDDLLSHVLHFGRADNPSRFGNAHAHGHGHHTTLTNRGLTGRKSVVASHLEVLGHEPENDEEEAVPRPSTSKMHAMRKMTSPSHASYSHATRLSMSEAATWERLSEMIRVDRRDEDDDHPIAVRGFSVQVMGWQRPDERKAVEQREVRNDFADIFHKTQEDMKRNRWVQE